jgi:hypothetical protein
MPPGEIGSTAGLTFEQAEGMLGFDLILPRYVPAGLLRPQKGQLYYREGKPFQFAWAYLTDPATPSSVFDEIIIHQSNLPISSLSIEGDLVTVSGVQVRVVVRAENARAHWANPTSVTVVQAFGKDGMDAETRKAELLRIVESMLSAPVSASEY